MRRSVIVAFAAALHHALASENGNFALAEKATEYLQEARAICEQDGGKLWGRSLCGPLLLVEPSSREIFADQKDEEGQLKRSGAVFVGKLPAQVNIANTAITWGGVKWTMIALPLPQERDRRAALLAHEMWHRIQEELGFPLSNPANNHLGEREGRYWLQLEWRALAAALQSRGESQTRALTDAEIFRARRRQLFPTAAEEERALEMNEGLAEYTGMKLSGTADLRQFAVRSVKEAPAQPTFVRSFAYVTGPAYGLLLDESGLEWRKNLQAGDDLAALLLKARNLSLPNDIAMVANERASAYQGETLARTEDEREQGRRAREKMYRGRLVTGPVLDIPLVKMNMQFDPQNIEPLGREGTVYPNIRVVDVWGILDVKQNGALMSSDFTRITLSAPSVTDRQTIKGDGWTLNLNTGWAVRAATPSRCVVEKLQP